MNKYSQFSKKEESRKWRSCERKVAFDTEEAAQQIGMRAYQCDYCKKWHRTGSLIKQVKKAAKKRG